MKSPQRPDRLTISYLRLNPDLVISPKDLRETGLAGSYSSIRRWVASGHLPMPITGPGGTMHWVVGDLLTHLGIRSDPGREASPETLSASPGKPAGQRNRSA